MRRLVTSIALLLLVFAGPPALAASGTALGVDPDARLEDKAGVKTLVVGTDVFIGDRIVTDARGLVQIRFSDKTELVVGPRSSLVIEDYLLREDGSGGKFAINALAGTFRFVTGSAPKDRYVITTPTATIGVRGTGFDFTVGSLIQTPDPGTSVLVFNGAVILCNLARKCIVIDELCELGEASTSDSQLLGSTDDYTGAEREALRARFRWAVSESELMTPFWIAHARECLNRATSTGTPKSLVETEDRPPQRDNGKPGIDQIP